MVLWKVVRKWLNLKSRVDDFNSDYSSAATGGRRTDKKGWKVCNGTECFVPVKGDESGVKQNKSAPATVKQRKFDSAATSSNKLNLSMFIGTWNVGGKTPDVGLNLKDWTQAHNFLPDLCIFGFQEIVPLNAANVLGVEDENPAVKWQVLNSGIQGDQDASHSIKSVNNLFPRYGRVAGDKPRIRSSDMLYLNESSQIKQQCSSPKTINRGEPVYCLAASKQMVGILLCVWVRAEIYQQINNLKVSCVGTGIMSYMGNKGSVSISITLYQTAFCFVCTRLDSGEKENDRIRRNHDVLEILHRTNFLPSRKSLEKPSFPSHILEHELASSYDDTHELLKKHEWQSLLERDQLLVEQRIGGVFERWQEGKIYFPPTYKYLINSDHYVNQIYQHKPKTPSPAWKVF